MLDAKRNALLSGSFATVYPSARDVKVWEFKKFSKKLDKTEDDISEFDAGDYNPGDDPNNEDFDNHYGRGDVEPDEN